VEFIRNCLLPTPIAPTPPLASTRTKLISAKRRKRIVESTDSEEEKKGKTPPPDLASATDFPPLSPKPFPQRVRRKREEKKGWETSPKDRHVYTGLTLKGEERKVDMYPPGLGEGKRAEHGALMSALTPVLESMSLQGDRKGPEFVALWAQLNSLKSQLCVLRGEDYSPPNAHGPSELWLRPGYLWLRPESPPTRSAPAKPVSLTMEQYVSPSVIGKGAKASRPVMPECPREHQQIISHRV